MKPTKSYPEKMLIAMINDIDVKNLFKKIKEFYGYTLDDLCVKDNHRHISEARQLAMYLLRSKCGMTLTGISAILERGNNTILTGIDSISWRLKYDKKFQERYKRMGYKI